MYTFVSGYMKDKMARTLGFFATEESCCNIFHTPLDKMITITKLIMFVINMPLYYNVN